MISPAGTAAAAEERPRAFGSEKGRLLIRWLLYCSGICCRIEAASACLPRKQVSDFSLDF